MLAIKRRDIGKGGINGLTDRFHEIWNSKAMYEKNRCLNWEKSVAFRGM